MPAAKLGTTGPLNAMKIEEGSDSIDTFIRQSVGKEPVLPSSRTGDTPVQWIQLLHALDQPDLPGWPLLTPLKVQMQKCEKCSREFCSSVNYRRHVRVHRRSLNVHKESHKYRDLLAEFWDKLSLEEVREIVLFNDVMLKEIPGSSVVRALASSIRKPAVWTLPQAYVKAGSMLLDILLAKPSRLPVSSQELFSILDDASECTFLCAGTAESVQKYVFDGETAKNSLELKNLIASSSFLFEQQLVKAWVADKDAEALRCQKLLVEEEEAAQKRQAEVLERKKQRKLRQKEQKAKEQIYECNQGLNIVVDDIDGQDSAQSPKSSSPSNENTPLPYVPVDPDAEILLRSIALEEEVEAGVDLSCELATQGNSLTFEHQPMGPNLHRHLAGNRWQVPKMQKGWRQGFHANHSVQTSRPETLQKLGPAKDRNPQNGSKVWAKKFKTENEGENLNPSSLPEDNVEENNCEVIIGSITVTLKSSAKKRDSNADEAQDSQHAECAMPQKKNTSEKTVKPDTVQSGASRVASKHWRPVSRGENKSFPHFDRGNEVSEKGPVCDEVLDRVMSDERCTGSESVNDDNLEDQKHCGDAQPGNVPFSADVAKEFLAQRWKEAISGDHVKLVLSSWPEPPGGSDIQQEQSMATHEPELQEHSGLGDAENEVVNPHAQFRKKPDKSLRTKYIPKQKAIA